MARLEARNIPLQIMRQSFGNHVYTSLDGYAPSMHPGYYGSVAHSAAPATVYTGYGSYHNAAIAADIAMQNPHDPIARAIARQEYKRMKKISGSTITGQPLAIPPPPAAAAPPRTRLCAVSCVSIAAAAPNF